ncbi:hypothetical protein BY996DRAFT_6516141 [Phakopsora pachyrhizi]|nr:hypothetical protein BY996DRAFT_6516141 [Phakopsora pachyrhizi]
MVGEMGIVYGGQSSITESNEGNNGTSKGPPYGRIREIDCPKLEHACVTAWKSDYSCPDYCPEICGFCK